METYTFDDQQSNRIEDQKKRTGGETGSTEVVKHWLRTE